MSTTPASISILIFKGEPLDYQRYRHTSLHITFTDQQEPFVAHAVGPPGEYEFQIREPYDSTEVQGIVRSVIVGDSLVPVGREQMIDILRAVPVRDWDVEFNCQIWVEAALRRLRDLRLLSSEGYTEGWMGWWMLLRRLRMRRSSCYDERLVKACLVVKRTIVASYYSHSLALRCVRHLSFV